MSALSPDRRLARVERMVEELGQPNGNGQEANRYIYVDKPAPPTGKGSTAEKRADGHGTNYEQKPGDKGAERPRTVIDVLRAAWMTRIVAKGQAGADRVHLVLLDRHVGALRRPVRQTKGDPDGRLRTSAGLPPRATALPDHDRVHRRTRCDRSMDPPLPPANHGQEQARDQEEHDDAERMHTTSIGRY
jgi:hypothetical protein